jgi:zinc protease
MKKYSSSCLFLLLIPFLFGFGQPVGDLNIKYEKYILKNGLKVILHEDRSDPVTAVAVQYHVGSNREVQGKTGFAHLFEHIMFQESQHVGQDEFFKKIQNAGGTLNGGTWQDGTIYYQVVPENALEMVLWLEADRMGFLLSTVTQESFTNQQEVVQNEKRQRYDNQPYGQTNYVIDKLLYPEDHPYNWQVIGSLEDLSNATLQDVHEFYKTWYGPNNATLVIAGSYNREKVKEWVEKYFGEIKSSDDIELPEPMNITLTETKRAYYEDSFAKSPELNMVFPTIQQFTDDSYALDALGSLLSDGKKAPFYKVIVEERKLAPSVGVGHSSLELTGTFRISIRSFPEISLSDIEKAIMESFQRFEKEGFTDKDLDRIKAKTQTALFNGITSVQGKSFQLAIYNEYAGSPDYIATDLEKMMSVSEADIWRVYNKYIKNRNYVLTSFVPKGKTELIADNSVLFEIEEEDISRSKAAGRIELEEIKVEKIPTSFDRTVEPAEGPIPEIHLPVIWKKRLENGMEVYGIEHNEVPLIQFNLTLKTGMISDNPDKIGTANLLANLLKEGTKNRTPVELEEAIDDLGAYLQIFASKESIVLQGNSIKENFEELFAIVEEILLEPRWDEAEFARLKEENLERIRRNKANPAIVASNVFSKLLYGDHPLANSTAGTEETIVSITIDDLKNYYEAYFEPQLAYITIAGSVDSDKALSTFSSLGSKWENKKIFIGRPDYPLPPPAEKAKLYFVDFPGAKQSELRVGYLALPYTDPDFYPATVMNYKLGGSFNGNVNLILREEKGYTYGARTGFSGTRYPGPFAATTAVQSNATLESLQIIMDEINKYRVDISDDNLLFTRNALSKSNALRFETLGALIGMLDLIANYKLPFDYIKQQEKVVFNMSRQRHLELANKYLDADKMIFLVVGDAATQLESVKELGLGEPVMLDSHGKPVK